MSDEALLNEVQINRATVDPEDVWHWFDGSYRKDADWLQYEGKSTEHRAY